MVYDWYELKYDTFRRRVLDAELRLAPGAWVLQVGCGNSGWSRALAADGYCALSTDIDPALLVPHPPSLQRDPLPHIFAPLLRQNADIVNIWTFVKAHSSLIYRACAPPGIIECKD
jgi:hypothetical protein